MTTLDKIAQIVSAEFHRLDSAPRLPRKLEIIVFAIDDPSGNIKVVIDRPEILNIDDFEKECIRRIFDKIRWGIVGLDLTGTEK